VNLKENNMLVDFEITCILIGSMIGLGIFNLPNILVKEAYESAWISVILGTIYPLYLGLLAMFISNKHPKENILILSRKYFGKIIGNLLNLIFLLHFVIYTSIVIAGFNNLYMVYIVSFLTPVKIVGIATFIAALTTYRGLKAIGRINIIAFFLTIFCSFLMVGAVKKGSYLNILPIFDTGLINIFKATKETFYCYGGIEIIFLIYPSAKNPKGTKMAIFKSIFITCAIYALATFITIFYLSADIVLKTNWSLAFTIESINIPILNNFRFIVSLLWVGIGFKVISNFYFSATFIAKDLFVKVSRKHIIFVLYIILTFISLKICENTIRGKFIDMVYPKLVIFVVAYTSLIALFVFFKKEVKNP